jgi:transposase-like protein
LRSRADRMAAAVEQGATLTAVATRNGVSPSAVHKACVARGVRTPRQGARERNKEILRELDAGSSPSKVAKKYGVNISVVYGARWRSQNRK